MRFSRSLFSLLSVLLWLSVSRPAGGQTWSEGDLQINRKRATAGFDASELTFGSGLSVAYDGTSKTVTVTASGTGLGTVTSFAFTNSTGITGTVTNATTTPTLSLALTSAAVGLGNVENTALSTWTGSSSLTTLGTISTGTWQGTAIGDSYISSAATWNGKLNASAVSAFGLTLIDDADAAAARTTLGLGSLATQNGTLTDYLTTATAATTYQPLDAQLTDVAGLAPTKGRLIVGDGTNWVDLGVGTNGQVLTADSAQAKGVKWAAGSGGIGGTVGAVNYGIPVADGTGGSTLQASPATLDDAGTLRTLGSFISEKSVVVPNDHYYAIFGQGGIEWSWADGDSTVYTGSIAVPATADGNWTWTLPQKSGTFAMLSDITGGVSDGDKGDIVVSSSGTVWSIDSGVITTAARTVLDDATVGDMVNTLGGATSTGTGGLVRASSPTLTTPNLGTPSAVTLTNATGLPLSTGVTGILPIANIATGTPDGTKFVRDDGTLAVPAGGGGSTSQWIGAGEWIPRTTAGAGVDSTETTTNDNNIDYLTFDAGATAEGAQWIGTLPNNYTGGTVTARFYWTASSGSGTVIWRLAGRALANDDALDTAAGTAQSVTDTLITAEDMHVSDSTAAVTIAGSPAANTPIIFTITRDSATDTLAVDARLIGVQITW